MSKTEKVLFTETQIVKQGDGKGPTYLKGSVHHLVPASVERWVRRGVATTDPALIAAAEAAHKPAEHLHKTPLKPEVTKPAAAATTPPNAASTGAPAANAGPGAPPAAAHSEGTGAAPITEVALHLQPIGTNGKKFNVIDDKGVAINSDPMTKADAEAFIASKKLVQGPAGEADLGKAGDPPALSAAKE